MDLSWEGDEPAAEVAGEEAAPPAEESAPACATPPEMIPYYRLNHSIRSLSDNKEASR
jgi:hypothetical protein